MESLGKKARETVAAEGKVDELIQDLNAAYADEWIAVYYYTVASQLVEGRTAPLVANALKELAKDELEHVQELGERILELGGTPVSQLAALQKQANCPKVALPKDERDLDGFINGVIEAERCAIGVYSKLLKKLGGAFKDPVTFNLVRHILAEEEAHEEEFENLL